MPLAFSITDHVGVIAAVVVVVLGLLVYGLADLTRFSPTRAAAVAKVAYMDALRRRVLWIAPLAIIGVLAVSQLIKPLDEQDAVNKTVRVCLFATGLVVTVTAIILGCTTLPKEIDNRVIYTIVTKPVTRLEIVAGKVLGLGGLSATILVIMGLFTYGYLHARAWSLERYVARRVAALPPDDTRRPGLQHVVDHGLLNAKQVATPTLLQVFGRLPKAGDDVRWLSGDADQQFVIPFDLDPATLPRDNTEAMGLPPLTITVRARAERPPDWRPEELGNIPAAVVVNQLAALNVQILDRELNGLVAQDAINSGDPAGFEPDGREQAVTVTVNPLVLPLLARQPVNDNGKVRVFLNVITVMPRFDYAVPTTDPVTLRYAAVGLPADQATVTLTPAGPASFRGRRGVYGFQIPGGEHLSVGVYRFNDVDLARSGRTVTAELKTMIERASDQLMHATLPTEVVLRVHDPATGELSAPVTMYPDNFVYAHAVLPVSDNVRKTGTFDVVVACATPYHWVSLNPAWFHVVAGEQPFGLNLAKSLLVFWLLSVLVTTVALLASTFLSWPIAVVLTVVVLLAHWGVQQVSDTIVPGFGRAVATELGLRDAASSEAVSRSVDALSLLLDRTAQVLPDISRFAAIEFIGQGHAMPRAALLASLTVLVGFGLPLGVLAYVLLRNKEVAP